MKSKSKPKVIPDPVWSPLGPVPPDGVVPFLIVQSNLSPLP